MTSGMKSTFVAGALTIFLAVSGGWLANTEKQAANTVRIDALEKEVKRNSDSMTKFGAEAKKVVYLQAKVGIIDKKLDEHGVWIRDSLEKMQAVEINSERTAIILEKLSSAVEKLADNTEKMTNLSTRLDERVKKLEGE